MFKTPYTTGENGDVEHKVESVEARCLPHCLDCSWPLMMRVLSTTQHQCCLLRPTGLPTEIPTAQKATSHNERGAYARKWIHVD
jgi:hypothetical protein